MAITPGQLVRSAFSCIPESYRKRLLFELAATCGVDKTSATGSCGEILGSVADRAVFQTYAITGNWSGGTASLVCRFLENVKSGTFIDIGANIGLTAIPVARLGNVQCILFEPEPQNFSLLSYNMQRNTPSGSYQLHNLALFDTDTELSFELAQANHGDHRVRVGAGQADSAAFLESSRKLIKVPGRCLDEIIDAARIKRPLVVKIDTQGAEYNVYKGGRKLLASADMVIVEFWPYGMKRMGGSPDTLLDMVSEDFTHGMLFEENADTSAARAMPLASLMEELRAVAADAGDLVWRDLVLLKTEAAGRIGIA